MALLTVSRSEFRLQAFNRSPIVALETDAASLDAIPSAIRAAVDSSRPASLSHWNSGKIPNGADAVITWLSGDQLLSGSPASLRHDARFPRRSFVPWHLPGLPEMPLLAIQPRCSSGQSACDYWNLSFRIAGSGGASAQLKEGLAANREPWSQLSLALLSEQTSLGAGIDPLSKLWDSRSTLPAVVSGLVIRNLAILHLRQKDSTGAEKLLELGLQMFPGYAELGYLAALWNFQQDRASRAIPLLEKTKTGDRGFLGCGGESSYRSDWLMGMIALRIGNERMAFDHLLRGLSHRPLFSPAAEELLRHRWPPRLIAAHQEEFARAAIYPHLREKVFDFFVQHRAYPAAQGLLQMLPFPEEQAEQYRARLRAAIPRPQPNERQHGNKARILISGPFFDHTSLARINCELAASLMSAAELETSLEPSARSTTFPETFPHGKKLHAAVLAPVHAPDLTIRHQWPPDFRRPSSGKLAVILPWEYGSVPRAWVRAIEANVDELWVPSEFARAVFRRAGVINTNIEVVPNGFDPEVFNPRGPISRPPGCRRFAFLFVGGAIRRKGIDVLLEAYRVAFDAGDDVTLILHLSGLAGSYQHNSLVANIRAVAADPQAPHIQMLSDSLDDKTMASLYRGCDALVLPYRGEGFGLPLLEAQACGKPVITNQQGPAREFCSEKTSYFISSREVTVADDPPPLGPMAGDFTWFEPDLGELIETMRQVCTHSRDASEKGRSAAQLVKRNFTWQDVTRKYRTRIRALTQSEFVAPQPTVAKSLAD
jgi:glycosyltransferase involved in cell wall biosynthesis